MGSYLSNVKAPINVDCDSKVDIDSKTKLHLILNNWTQNAKPLCPIDIQKMIISFVYQPRFDSKPAYNSRITSTSHIVKPYHYLLKFIVIGDKGIGKSSLIHRYVYKQFPVPWILQSTPNDFSTAILKC